MRWLSDRVVLARSEFARIYKGKSAFGTALEECRMTERGAACPGGAEDRNAPGYINEERNSEPNSNSNNNNNKADAKISKDF